MPKVRKTPRKGKFKLDETFLYKQYLTPTEDGRLRSVRDVALENGVSNDTLQKVATKNRWNEKRKQHQIDTKKQYELKLTEDANFLMDDMRKFWIKAHEVSKIHLDVILEAVKRPEITEELQKTKEGIKLLKTITSGKNLREYMEAFKVANNALRVWNGLPSDISKSDVTSRILTTELPEEELEKMDNYMSAIGNKKSGETPAKHNTDDATENTIQHEPVTDSGVNQ